MENSLATVRTASQRYKDLANANRLETERVKQLTSAAKTKLVELEAAEKMVQQELRDKKTTRDRAQAQLEEKAKASQVEHDERVVGHHAALESFLEHVKDEQEQKLQLKLNEVEEKRLALKIAKANALVELSLALKEHFDAGRTETRS